MSHLDRGSGLEVVVQIQDRSVYIGLKKIKTRDGIDYPDKNRYFYQMSSYRRLDIIMVVHKSYISE